MYILGSIRTWESYLEFLYPYAMSFPVLFLACLAFFKARHLKPVTWGPWTFVLWTSVVIVWTAAVIVVVERWTNSPKDGLQTGGWITLVWMTVFKGSPETTMWWRDEWYYSSLLTFVFSFLLVVLWKRIASAPHACSCHSCSYSMVGLAGAVQCPECGKSNKIF